MYKEEEFVTMPVPKSRVEDVYRLLGTPQGSGVVGVGKTRSKRENGQVKWWPKERLALLKREMPNPTILLMLNLAAERPLQGVGFDELCRETGRSVGQVKNDLGRLTSYIKDRFADNKVGWWPVVIHPTVPATYSMPDDLAAMWREVR